VTSLRSYQIGWTAKGGVGYRYSDQFKIPGKYIELGEGNRGFTGI